MAVSAPTTTQLDLRNLTGADVLADLTPWVSAYEEVYAHVLHLPDHNDPPFGERLAFSAARPGFRMTVAHVDGDLVGFVYGYTLPTTTGWWDGFTPAPGVDAQDMVDERPGRTLAVCEGLVRTPYRHTGLVERAMPFFLSGRTEERAASLVAEGNDHALDIAVRNGWLHVGELAPHDGWRRHHCLIMPLRG
ncbi:GNAT family N-acetyltransferase [Nocardiopsis sp. FIRDI 009]|uniref:GNAT family N-acetyltransferase n=1 Tax=Nocardiopsis sp. FIRDI 009 TaxID=714197 RepID=UPI000E2833AD|nr:GNAT family N-acetyltransferase [Nocardiopsis sp. FIRDI 009]